ncbi:uncharacterized protein [Coffea arabica]|uniref:Uncharacterized protein isoform X2 n=1 Tax=Coffea arabica TaxID=13443 RepID=A0ABM4VX60_COFAR
MAVSVATGLKSLFILLGCLMTATLIYTIATDGLPFRKELLTPWMTATLIDFYINILALGAWVIYKESNWISAILWIILLVCLGSITACAYIVLQLFKLSPQESSQDPVYYVLLRHKKKDGPEKKSLFSVVIARFMFGALGFLMLGTLIYTIATDGSPFRRDVLTPWLSATLVDFYINVVALSVWIAYKESSWIGASFWIILLICFGSISTCAYILLQLYQLSSEDLVYLILFNSSNRAENGYERVLQRGNYSGIAA